MGRGEAKRPPRQRRGGEVVRAPDMEPEVVALGRERARAREARELSAARAEIEVLQKELAQALVQGAAPRLTPELVKAHRLGPHCNHHNVTVHEGEGLVRCNGCDKEVDPIQVLLWYAGRERRFLDQEEHCQAELRRLRNERENGERQLKNLKAAIRRAAARATDLGIEVKVDYPWLSNKG